MMIIMIMLQWKPNITKCHLRDWKNLAVVTDSLLHRGPFFVYILLLLAWPQLFKSWIALSTG